VGGWTTVSLRLKTCLKVVVTFPRSAHESGLTVNQAQQAEYGTILDQVMVDAPMPWNNNVTKPRQGGYHGVHRCCIALTKYYVGKDLPRKSVAVRLELQSWLLVPKKEDFIMSWQILSFLGR